VGLKKNHLVLHHLQRQPESLTPDKEPADARMGLPAFLSSLWTNHGELAHLVLPG
jgi:hypothetical protein